MFRVKGLSRFIIMGVVFALAGMFVVPGIALGDDLQQPTEHCIHADNEQLSIIRALWGEEVAFVDFLELVDPKVLEGVSKRMIEQASASRLHWGDIGDSVKTQENLSDVDIYWGYLDNEDVEWFWARIVSDTKQITTTVLDCLYSKVPATAGQGGKRVTIQYDDAGRPSIGPVVDMIPETLRREQVVQEAEPERSPSNTSSSDKPNPMRYSTTTHAKAWCDDPLEVLYTGEEAWQTFTWDGDDVTGITAQGAYYYRFVPFWVHTSGFWQDKGPEPPTSKHTTYAEGHFDYYHGGYVHEIDVWSYAYGDGTVNGARNFSGDIPFPGYTEFEYW